MCPEVEQRPLQVNIDSSAKRTPYSVDEWSATGSGFSTPSEEIHILVGSDVNPRHVLNMPHNGEFLSLCWKPNPVRQSLN
jgi:hypothetical protein